MSLGMRSTRSVSFTGAIGGAACGRVQDPSLQNTDSASACASSSVTLPAIRGAVTERRSGGPTDRDRDRQAGRPLMLSGRRTSWPSGSAGPKEPRAPIGSCRMVRWYQYAARQGLADAQFRLACCYDGGLDVAQDEREAARWYRMAAAQGHADAQYNLAICYRDGSGVPADAGMAAHWFRRAARQGHAGAQFALGACYADGLGVQRDSRRSLKWFLRAAAQGDVDAMLVLSSLEVHFPA